MQNRILHLARQAIPFVKELMPLAGSINGCLLLQQLDYWFARYPGGFWKYTAPASSRLYTSGDSWTEELAVSVEVFRATLLKFCTVHKSRAAFEATDDKFQGKFFCCYHDRGEGYAYYYRNHALLDAALDSLFDAEEQSGGEPGAGGSSGSHTRPFPKIDHGLPAVLGISVTGHASRGIPESRVEKTPSPYIKIQKPVQKLKLLPQPAPVAQDRSVGEQAAGGGGGFFSVDSTSLVFPNKISSTEQQALCQLLVQCPANFHQPVLDEVEGACRENAIRSGLIPFARWLVLAVNKGDFSERRGVTVRAGREAAANSAKREQLLRQKLLKHVHRQSPEEAISALPVALRASLALLSRHRQERMAGQFARGNA